MRRVIASIFMIAATTLAISSPTNAVAQPPIAFYFSQQSGMRWIDVAVSSSGEKGYAALNTTVGYNDKVYRTEDGGRTYVQLAGSPAGSWRAIDTDATGQYVWGIVATATDDTEVYMSSDSGETWTGVIGHNAPGEYFRDVAVSDDHLRVVIAASGFNSMITLDGGATLSNMASAGADLYHIDISGDGNTVAATYGGSVYQYDIVGDSWSYVTVTSSSAISSISVSSNGLRITVSSHQGPDADLWRSVDGGMSYTDSNFASEFGTTSQSVTANMSADGLTILVGQYGGPLYLSRDGGATWTNPQGLLSGWLAFAVSANGLRGIGAVEGVSNYFFGSITPALYEVAPNQIDSGSSGYIGVSGDNFYSSCVVELDGERANTSFINYGYLTFYVYGDDPDGLYDVTVNCDGLVSDPVSLRIGPVPTTTTAPPTTVPNTLVVTGNRSAEASRLAFVLLAFGAVLALWAARARRVN